MATREKSPEEMAQWAVSQRARAEATIVRGYFLNKVLPAIEREMIRRVNSHEPVAQLVMPEVEEFAQAFLTRLGVENNIPELQ